MNGSTLAAIISHLGYATGDLFAVKSARKVGGQNSAFWISVLLLLIVELPVILFVDVPNFTLSSIVAVVILSVIITISSITFNLGLEKGNASLVGTIAGAFPALVVVLSIIFYDEVLNTSQLVAVAITIFGIILSSLDLKSITSNKKRKLDISIVYALITFVTWGVYFTFIRNPIEQIGWAWTNLATGFFGVIILAIVLNKRIKNIPKKQPSVMLKFILPTAIITGIANLCFNYAIENGQSSIVAPIAGSYTALFVVFAHFVFKESLNRQQLFGVILTLVGVIGLTIVG